MPKDWPYFQSSLTFGEHNRDMLVVRDDDWEKFTDKLKKVAALRKEAIKKKPEEKKEAVQSSIITCPKCKGPMVMRTARNSGKQFWGCKKYPECDGTIWTDK